MEKPLRGLDAGANNGPRLLLAEHHRELETTTRELMARVYADEPGDLVVAYRTFERATLAHLDAEEEMILPAFADQDPAEADALRREHAEIRQLLYRVGVEVELHVIRAETMRALVEGLRRHARRGDAVMYPWAQLHLPLRTKRLLFVRLGNSLRDLVRLRSPARRTESGHRASI